MSALHRATEFTVVMVSEREPKVSLHSKMRDFLAEHGYRVISTGSGSVCAVCLGNGRVPTARSGCFVTGDAPCAACDEWEDRQ
jgi:hypothetical protein